MHHTPQGQGEVLQVAGGEAEVAATGCGQDDRVGNLEAVPLAQLKARVTEVCELLLKKNPFALKATKDAVRRVKEMTYENAEDYLIRAQESANFFDNEGRKEGIRQFIDEKTFKPGIGTYDLSKQKK